MSDDLVKRLHEEGLGFGIGPAGLCQEAATHIEALTAENARLRALTEWQDISTAPPGKTLILYNPKWAKDTGYPGHPIEISNPDYVRCGNAKQAGFTHWALTPEPPK